MPETRRRRVSISGTETSNFLGLGGVVRERCVPGVPSQTVSGTAQRQRRAPEVSTPQHAPRRLRRGQCLVVFGFLGRPICQARCPARWAELCWPEGWLSKCTVCRTLAAYLTCRPCPVSSRTRGPRRRGAGSGASPQLGGKPAETKVPRPVPADAHKAKRHAPPVRRLIPPSKKNMYRRPPVHLKGILSREASLSLGRAFTQNTRQGEGLEGALKEAHCAACLPTAHCQILC